MDPLRQVFGFFRISPDEKDIIRTVIGFENVRRVQYIALIAIPASALYIALFWPKLEDATGIELQWRIAISISHVSILVSFLAISILLYLFPAEHSKKVLAKRLCVNLTIFILLMGGAVITAADQLVTYSITPYIFSCIISGLIILLPPLFSSMYYILAYIVFYFAISQTQVNHDVLVSNQINGITATGVGLCLSFIMWRGYIIRVRQNRVIEKQTAELIESNALKDRFFSIIGHDLKSPLSGIMTLSGIIYEGIKENNTEKIEKYVDAIKSSSENTYKLLENLLEWSLSQTGRMTFNPECINLCSMIKDKVEEYSAQAKTKNITLQCFNDENLLLYADGNMLKTIFRNLISNSIKFTHSGGRIEIRAGRDVAGVKISVSDNGIGMNEKTIDQLFSFSKSITNSGTAQETGTGLGLILCRDFVEKHGGKIWAESQPGKGSVFHFTIPVCEKS